MWAGIRPERIGRLRPHAVRRPRNLLCVRSGDEAGNAGQEARSMKRSQRRGCASRSARMRLAEIRRIEEEKQRKIDEAHARANEEAKRQAFALRLRNMTRCCLFHSSRF